MMRKLCIAFSPVMALAACNPAPTYQRATEIAYEQAAELTYEDVGARSDCLDDCSGHNAGFEWARENGVTQSWDCPVTRSPSFVEGCEAFAQYVSVSIEEQRWEP
jgi:hypothetical protein